MKSQTLLMAWMLTVLLTGALATDMGEYIGHVVKSRVELLVAALKVQP